jgi:hypothetical protein
MVAGCAPTEDEDVGSTALALTETPSRVHLMRMTNVPPSDAPSIDAPTIRPPVPGGLNYFGGPLVQHINVIQINWNTGVAFGGTGTGTFNSFYNFAVSSTFMNPAFFSQYTAGGQTISTGTVATPVNDTDTLTNVADLNIQFEVLRLINTGAVPRPNANNYYVVHFPPGVSITSPDGSQSCVAFGFCAYHGTFQVRDASGNIIDVFYGVMPDQGGGCAGGCGADASRFNNSTSVASHEYTETQTDAAVGLATTFAFPLGWYDQTANGEIGDLCNAIQTSSNGFVFQKEFSNATLGCVNQVTNN